MHRPARNGRAGESSLTRDDHRGEGVRAGSRDRCGTRRRRRPPVRRTPSAAAAEADRAGAPAHAAPARCSSVRVSAAGKRGLRRRRPASPRAAARGSPSSRRPAGERGSAHRAPRRSRRPLEGRGRGEGRAGRHPRGAPTRRVPCWRPRCARPGGAIVASTQTRRPPCSIALASRLSSACATRHGSAIAIAAPARQRSSSERRACRGTTAPALDGELDQGPAGHRPQGEGARRAVDLTVEVVERGKRQLRRGRHRGPAR